MPTLCAVPSLLGRGHPLEFTDRSDSDRVGAKLEPLLNAARPAVLHGYLKPAIRRWPVRHPGNDLTSARRRQRGSVYVRVIAQVCLPATR
jgi:hypothetical protein